MSDSKAATTPLRPPEISVNVVPIQQPFSPMLTPFTMEKKEIKEMRLDSPAAEQPPRTKIICTIGPQSKSKDVIRNLLNAGMNVCRCNFSHGDYAYHGEVMQNVKAVTAEMHRICAILLDTKGPEIRTGKLKDGKEVQLTKGQEFMLIPDYSIVGDNKRVGVQYPNIAKVLKPGNAVLCSDGLISMTVLEVKNDTPDVKQHYVKCRVNNHAVLGQTKGVNLPNVKVDLPAVTEKDIEDIKFGVEQGIDIIAASFTRTRENVETIRALLKECGPKARGIKICAKIENQEGLDNFDAILDAADGIMVARGDLGVEIPIEQVSLAQKMMIRKCNLAGKFVVTATQMLESMIKNPSPTRAEASDVANAVFDGTDCVMLSGETANGSYPIEAVKIMAAICREAEASTNYRQLYQMLKDAVESSNSTSIAEAIAAASVKASLDLKASMLLVMTETGNTARLVAKYRPKAPVLTITNSESCARNSLVTRGLFPLLVDSMIGAESLISRALAAAKKLGMVKVGEMVIVVSGSKEGVSGATNDMKVIAVNF